jgi:Acyl-CoA dehydrogenase, C-terminal domain
MRVFGGYGSSKEYPVEQLYRAAPLLMIGEGTRFLNPTPFQRPRREMVPALALRSGPTTTLDSISR